MKYNDEFSIKSALKQLIKPGNTRYIIRARSFFTISYMRIVWVKKWQGELPQIENSEAGEQFATKFRLKYVADILAALCNWIATQNLEMKRYEVVKIETA